MRSMQAAVGAVFISALLFSGAVAVAHDAHDPRHRVMENLGEHMKALHRAVEGAAAIGAGASSSARALKEGAQKLLSLFPEGSRGRKGSREKPEIWSDWSGFAAASTALEKAADDVVDAASSGDKARLATALKAAGRKCAGCHDRYRAPEK